MVAEIKIFTNINSHGKREKTNKYALELLHLYMFNVTDIETLFRRIKYEYEDTDNITE